MTRKEQIRSAYRLTGGNASFYDGMMTYSTLPGKAICRAVWNMDAEKNLRYIEQALSGVPMDFSGKLLEVPVGTGVLTMPVYRDLPDADSGYDERGKAKGRICRDQEHHLSAGRRGRAAVPRRELRYRAVTQRFPRVPG